MRVFLATSNPAKLKKMRWLLEGIGLTYATPNDPPPLPPIPEEGRTHRDNAKSKARAWSLHSGMLSIATDGGLVIPVLGQRWDSLRTARFAGPGATDQGRLHGLLDLMQPYRGDDRTAFWIEALAIAQDGRILKSWEVESEPGLLAEHHDPAAVTPGFWAFSLWYIPRLGKTYDHLSPEDLESVDDHWRRLRKQVQAWFSRRPRSPCWTR